MLGSAPKTGIGIGPSPSAPASPSSEAPAEQNLAHIPSDMTVNLVVFRSSTTSSKPWRKRAPTTATR